MVFGGDVLFNGSVGRTDLPGGDPATLMATIQSQFLSLPDSTVVHSGHGPDTTIGVERLTNPFLTGAYPLGLRRAAGRAASGGAGGRAEDSSRSHRSRTAVRPPPAARLQPLRLRGRPPGLGLQESVPELRHRLPARGLL